ncbi:TetR/AcrR family transcriptional regulator [Micromonospora okii]|uniref:TetR/AcrR family transcriptional regulator n=1 Tax=Micromonospora okii TaxID=1182970 RepID=UPI001E55A81F|nr:TetR family transcriptional regulator [Micromonospora okii]
MPRRRPGRPRRAENRDTREVVLAAATALFAARGFDAVGLRQVAAAAGVDVATVSHHTGTKAQLYDACFARVFAAERQALESATRAARVALDAGPVAARQALHDLVDVFVDFLEARPETTALWLRRWLEPHRHAELDQRYSTPLYDLVEGLLRDAAAAGALVDPTPRVTVRGLVWAVHGHVVALAVPGGPEQGERREFRAWLHRVLHGLYGPTAP